MKAKSGEDQLEKILCRFIKTKNWPNSVRQVLGKAKNKHCPEVEEWRNHPYILYRLKEARETVNRTLEATLEDHVRILGEIRDEARSEGKYAAAVSAEVSRGKALGYYEQKKNNVIEGESKKSLSTDDLKQRLKHIKRMKDQKSLGHDSEDEDISDAELL